MMSLALGVAVEARQLEFEKRIRDLPEQHRLALQWFLDHAGRVERWPEPIAPGVFLATKAKGIFKPQWSKYALSIRQNLAETYPDRDPKPRPDGSWAYPYFQEGYDLGNPESVFTNRALFNCWRDGVPVGVLRQVTAKPHPTYSILGLALVTGWRAGYFILEGEGPVLGLWTTDQLAVDPSILDVPAGQLAAEERLPAAGRERVLAEIVRRQGQPVFRRALLDAYKGRCAFSGYDAPQALEAAHIVPYNGPNTNTPENGLLLRADFHTLFDLGMIAVDTDSMSLLLSSELASTSYRQFEGQPLRLPRGAVAPSVDRLIVHREWAGL